MSGFKRFLLLSATSMTALATWVFIGAAAAAEPVRPTLSVHTYDSFITEWGPAPALEPLFEAACGCDVVFKAAEDGVALLNRLRIEQDRTDADVILGLDQGLIPEAERLGLVMPHGVDAATLKAELEWRNSHFLPYDYGFFAFVYNRQTVTQPAASMAALLEGDARVIYQDPRTSTPGQGLLFWIETLYGDQSAAAWKRLAQRTVTVTKGWSEAYNLFLQGEADYVLSYTTSPAYHLVAENDDRYRAAQFAEGHVAQIEVAGISRFSRQPDLARRFLAFLISPAAQEILPVTNWMLPVIDGVKLPAAFAGLPQPQRLPIDADDAAARREAWIRNWRSAVVQ